MAIECLREIGQEPHEKTKASEEGVNKYKQVFGLRAVHLMAFFIFTYVGVEVSIGGMLVIVVVLRLALVQRCWNIGWIVTYIINERNGGANSGYISSGFWGGGTVNAASSENR